MFDYFWDTVDTIEPGLGYKLFSPIHLAELFVALVFILIVNYYYKKSNDKKRKSIRKWIVIALIADELFKHVCLLISGNWTVGYLPLHLCSINLFLITYHYFTNSMLVGNFLWAVALPAALSALVTPNWSSLPVVNFMHLHSYTVHVLILTYPIIVTINHDIKKDFHYIPKILVMVTVMAACMYGVNLLLDTNFMFLMYPVENTALTLVQDIFKFYQLGLFVIVFVVVILMYIPYKVDKV